jgi:hypothetical protein
MASPAAPSAASALVAGPLSALGLAVCVLRLRGFAGLSPSLLLLLAIITSGSRIADRKRTVPSGTQILRRPANPSRPSTFAHTDS